MFTHTPLIALLPPLARELINVRASQFSILAHQCSPTPHEANACEADSSAPSASAEDLRVGVSATVAFFGELLSVCMEGAKAIWPRASPGPAYEQFYHAGQEVFGQSLNTTEGHRPALQCAVRPRHRRVVKTASKLPSQVIIRRSRGELPQSPLPTRRHPRG